MVEAVEQFLTARNETEADRDEFDRYCAKRKLHLSCPVIHVTGSNGKSCIARFLEGIYTAAGYKVGCFISPTPNINEGIRFNEMPINDAELASIFDDCRKDFEKFNLDSFACATVLAYRYFESKKPDLAIVEVGMGGALDPTNIDMDTRLAIIANISIEHTELLGTTLSQIALHKAGIIKPQEPVLLGKLEDDALSTIREQADDVKAPIFRVEDHHFNHLVENKFHFDYGPYKDLVINTFAEYQLRNASMAIEAVRILEKAFPVSEEALREGLLKNPLPCRCERLGRIVFDGGHNPEAASAVARCAPTIGRGRPVHILFASFREKNIAVELPTLANVVPSITLTTFPSPFAREEMDFFLYAEDHPYVEDPIGAVKALLEQYPEDTILLTGSMEFCFCMREIILKEGLGQ